MTGLARSDDRPPLWASQPPTVLDAVVAVEHAVSMGLYRQSMLERPVEPHNLFPVSTRWLWMTPEGSSIQRVATNTFRITDRNCLNSFCAALDCIVGTWPQLFCHNGQEHSISAPDLQTVILDDRTFRREMVAGPVPPTEPDAAAEPDQNTAR